MTAFGTAVTRRHLTLLLVSYGHFEGYFNFIKTKTSLYGCTFYTARRKGDSPM